MLVRQSADGRVLPHVHGRTHRALPVDEVGEGEGEVAALVLLLPLHWLHEPLAEPDELLAEKAALDQVVERLEEQGAGLVGDPGLPGAAELRHLLQGGCGELPQVVRLLPVPEHPELPALGQLVLVVMAGLGRLDLVTGVVEGVVH